MKKPHTKARGILFAAAGMFLIPGSVSEVSAAERKDEQPFIQASGIESVLEKCYETEVKDNINLYLVPTEEGEYLNMVAGLCPTLFQIRDFFKIRLYNQKSTHLRHLVSFTQKNQIPFSNDIWLFSSYTSLISLSFP